MKFLKYVEQREICVQVVRKNLKWKFLKRISHDNVLVKVMLKMLMPMSCPRKFVLEKE